MSQSESVLVMWTRLEASMDCLRVTNACREAVRALEVIRPMGGEAGEIAGRAILRVEAELRAEVDLGDDD